MTPQGGTAHHADGSHAPPHTPLSGTGYYVAVPDPGKFGITPGTAAALAAVVDEKEIRL